MFTHSLSHSLLDVIYILPNRCVAQGLLSLDGSLSHEASTLSAHAPTATRSGDSLTGGAPAPTPGHSGRGLGLYKAAFANSQKELPYEVRFLRFAYSLVHTLSR